MCGNGSIGIARSNEKPTPQDGEWLRRTKLTEMYVMAQCSTHLHWQSIMTFLVGPAHVYIYLYIYIYIKSNNVKVEFQDTVYSNNVKVESRGMQIIEFACTYLLARTNCVSRLERGFYNRDNRKLKCFKEYRWELSDENLCMQLDHCGASYHTYTT